ncbi:PLP-dependent aminotransferase family protein [soil metagenome]
MFRVTLDPSSLQPLTDQIVGEIRKRIVQRAIKSEARLPSIRQFAETHSVASSTVVAAYDRLAQEGFLKARKGSGYYVAPKARPSATGTHVALNEAEDVLWIVRRSMTDDKTLIKAGAAWLPPEWQAQDAVRQALLNIAADGVTSALSYGEPRGLGALRTLLSSRLSSVGINASPEQIILTHGASQAIDLVARFLVKSGDAVLVDDPGYSTTFGLLKMLGARVYGVPRTPQGPDLAALETLMTEHRPKLLFTTAAMHNPTSTSMTQANAYQVLRLAEKFKTIIVEDDNYGELDDKVHVRLAALDQLQRVIYIAGFSKSMAKGLRAGYLAASQDIVESLLDIKLLTGLTTSGLNEQIVYEIISSGAYDRHLVKLRKRLDQKRQVVSRKLRDLGMEFFGEPDAGMFIFAKSPHITNTAQFASNAEKQGVLMGPGHLFRPHMESSPWLRFNVAYCDHPAVYALLKPDAEL